MKTYEVTFQIEVEEDATSEQVEEWLEFELGANGSMSASNPLRRDIDAYNVIIRD